MSWFRRKTPPVLSPLDAYNKWAASYAVEKNPIKNFSDELIEKFLPELNDKSVLDLGCGTGKFCRLAEHQGAHTIHGIDLSPEMIAKCKELPGRSTFECDDVSSVKLTATFDVVICSLVLGHIEHLRPTLIKITNAVKPGGMLILTDFHPFLTLSNSRRTFVDLSTGKQFEVKHYLHLFGEYLGILQEQGMSVENFEEPLYRKTPVVFAIKARKQG
jgi:malonyl-CoA O-methyltransferase